MTDEKKSNKSRKNIETKQKHYKTGEFQKSLSKKKKENSKIKKPQVFESKIKITCQAKKMKKKSIP